MLAIVTFDMGVLSSCNRTDENGDRGAEITSSQSEGDSSPVPESDADANDASEPKEELSDSTSIKHPDSSQKGDSNRSRVRLLSVDCKFK